MNFTPTQQQTLLSKMGYQGPADPKLMEAFLASNPGAAAKMGKFSRAAQKMAPAKGLAKGGPITSGMGGVGEAEGSVQVWFYDGRQYGSYQSAAAARDKDLAAMQPASTTTTGTDTGTDTGTTTRNTTSPDLDDLYKSQALSLYNELRSGGPSSDYTTVASLAGLEGDTDIDVDAVKAMDVAGIEQFLRNSGTYYKEGDQIKKLRGSLDPLTLTPDLVGQLTGNVTGISAPQGTTMDLTAAKQAVSDATSSLAQATRNLEANPESGELQIAFERAQKAYADAQSNLNLAQTQFSTTSIPTPGELVGKATADPLSLTTTSTVSKLGEAKPGQLIGTDTGQATTERTAPTTTVGETAQAAGPTVTDAATYDAAQAAGGIKEELRGVERDYKSVSWQDAGFTPPPAGTVTTQAFETFHNPTTGEQVTVSSGGYTAPEGWVKGAPEGKFKTEGLKGAVGEVSQKITAAEMDPTMLAQLNLPAEQINIIREVVDNGDLEITEGQLAEAATLANQGIPLPQAIAQVTGQPGEVIAAKFESATPEAQAQTDYQKVTTGTARGVVETDELVIGQGVGLNPEQSEKVKADYDNSLEAAKGTVQDGELIDSEASYNLPPTDAAVLNETLVQEAAKAKDITAEAAQSSFESTLEAAEGTVGSKELVDAKDVTKVIENVEAFAATMEALDAAAVAQARTGTLSQAALAIAAQGTVPPSATVAGQMSNLMEQFNDGTPAWAAGAMRAANAAMAARGVGASSMAGAAIVQAAMEAAMPIAQSDAQTFMQMELTNLSNRQQVALANAAAQQNMELANLNNQQQTALQNSANAFALQSQNLSNQQATVLANAQMKAALQGQVLDVYTQAALTNAARYAEINNLNLNNEQQVLLQRSAQNLQVDLTNLDARQQTALANLQVQASLRGQELTNEQQMAMLKSTQAFSAAEFNANAQQQAFLQDAAARLAMEGKVMDITQQTAMFNASRIAQVNDVNLTNEQQVLLQRSAENLQVDLANLSTESQTALANAQLRAALQGKVLDNQQQAAVLNAARYAEVNNLNLTNRQQALMQDANIMASMEGKVLDNRQQAAIFNVANQIEERGLELNNEQQTRLFNMTNKVNIDLANLSNKQQTSLANAQIEASLRGQELTNAQQTGVINAARISEVANLNFTADQERALQNAKLAQTVDVENLNARSAKLMADVAAMANVDITNLNNRQQAQVQNAQNFLQMDLANLSNEQQADMFASQSIINSMLSDQAAENAALQFNAASENQVTQFFENLSATVSQFNTAQKNAIAQFNAGEANATERLNAQLESARDQFNAANSLIVAQANAKWNQQLSTIDTAEQNEANRNAAATANALTLTALNEVFQKERDLMDFAFTSAEGAADRALNILLADKEAALSQAQQASAEDASKSYLWTRLAYDFVSSGSGADGKGPSLLDKGLDLLFG